MSKPPVVVVRTEAVPPPTVYAAYGYHPVRYLPRQPRRQRFHRSAPHKRAAVGATLFPVRQEFAEPNERLTSVALAVALIDLCILIASFAAIYRRQARTHRRCAQPA